MSNHTIHIHADAPNSAPFSVVPYDQNTPSPWFALRIDSSVSIFLDPRRMQELHARLGEALEDSYATAAAAPPPLAPRFREALAEAEEGEA
jgi:hypothetical protein